MDRIADMVFISMLISPFILNGLLLVVNTNRLKQVLRVFLGSFVLLLVFFFSLGVYEYQLPFNFLGEQIFFRLSSTPVILFLISIAMFWFSIDFPHPQIIDINSFSKKEIVVFCLSLFAGSVALFSGQFLMRYIGLEILGFLIALIAFNKKNEKETYRDLVTIFLYLRLGDLFLLAAILMIYPYSRTLDIREMIQASSTIPLNVLIFIIIAFVISILFKTAVWPFTAWVTLFSNRERRIIHWVPKLFLPIMGYYLLYRIIPIIQSHEETQFLIGMIAFLLALSIMVGTYFSYIESDNQMSLSGLLSCFALAFSSFGSPQSLYYYLVVIIGLSYFLDVGVQLIGKHTMWISAVFLSVINFGYLYFNIEKFPPSFVWPWVIMTLLVVVWQFSVNNIMLRQILNRHLPITKIRNQSWRQYFYPMIGWAYQEVEIGLFHQDLVKVAKVIPGISTWLYQNIEIGLDKMWITVGRWLNTISETALFQYENAGQLRVGNALNKALLWIKEKDQQAENRPLHMDLVWIPVLLIAIILFIVVYESG